MNEVKETTKQKEPYLAPVADVTNFDDETIYLEDGDITELLSEDVEDAPGDKVTNPWKNKEGDMGLDDDYGLGYEGQYKNPNRNIFNEDGSINQHWSQWE